MIDHIWTLICSNAIIDKDTNNVSIFNVIEQLTIPNSFLEKDIIGIRFEIITLWSRTNPIEPSIGNSIIDLYAPNGKLLKSLESKLDLSTYERLRTRGQFEGLPFKGDGIYRFVIKYRSDQLERWKKVASIPLQIKIENDK